MSDDRAYPARPIVGVGAVILPPGGVVLVKRRTPPLLGTWSLPGGAVEVGETLAQAVAREAREEKGLEGTVGSLVDVIERLHRDPSGRMHYHYVLLDYACTAVGGALEAGSDAEEAAVVSLDALAARGVSPGTIEVIGKAAALLAGVHGAARA
jgi:8-oxo-dGTP diphosphatase